MGSQAGHQVLDGEVKPYDQSSFDETEKIVTKLNNLTFSFGEHFPKSVFAIEASQSVAITGTGNNP